MIRRISAISLLTCTMFVVGAVAPFVAQAANKVQTQRVVVPEEKARDGSEPSDEKLEDDAAGVEIPTDALPSLEPSSGEADTADDEKNAAPPPIMRDLSKLPDAVKTTRDNILKAAKSGKIDRLRGLIGKGETATSLSISGLDGDPISFLKEASGDDDGYEILAILIEVLEAGYVHVDQGTDEELYIWPYYFAWPLDQLSPRQTVEMYQLLTAGDVEDSQSFGGYIFYRVGIKPNGQWSFFVAGD